MGARRAAGASWGCIIQLSWRLLRKAAAYLNPEQRVPRPGKLRGRLENASRATPPVTKSCVWQPNALIRRAAMLGTSVNPTDELRFEGRAAQGAAEGDAHPKKFRGAAPPKGVGNGCCPRRSEWQ